MTVIPKELMSDLQKYADMSEDTKRLCMTRILEKDPSLRLILLVPDLFEKVMAEMENTLREQKIHPTPVLHPIDYISSLKDLPEENREKITDILFSMLELLKSLPEERRSLILDSCKSNSQQMYKKYGMSDDEAARLTKLCFDLLGAY